MNRMVADVMASPVVSVQPGTSFRGMIQLLATHQISALPVVDPDGRLLGIVSETDLVRKEEQLPPGRTSSLFAAFVKPGRPARTTGTTAADFMSAPVITIPSGASLTSAARLLHERPVITIPSGASLTSAARLLHERNITHLPVVDADGRLVGILGRRDLLSVFLQAEDDLRHTITASVLRGMFNLPPDAVEVEVDEGVVTLAGRVPWRSTAWEVVDRVRGLNGVVDVVDRLAWAHDGTVSYQ